jgi:hypothetical protein
MCSFYVLKMWGSVRCCWKGREESRLPSPISLFRPRTPRENMNSGLLSLAVMMAKLTRCFQSHSGGPQKCLGRSSAVRNLASNVSLGGLMFCLFR